jgi:hypothetical protein
LDEVTFGVDDGDTELTLVETGIDEFEDGEITPVPAVEEMVSE